MKKSNSVTSNKKPGRQRREVSHDDFVVEPTETMLLLAHLKNQGHSWRTLADEVNYRIHGPKVSHALIRRVTLGHCKSARVDYALGLRKERPPVSVPPCPHCGEVHMVGWCVKEEGEPKKPRNGNRRRTRRPPRLQIRKDDPASAAASIRRNLPPHAVSRLVELLLNDDSV